MTTETHDRPLPIQINNEPCSVPYNSTLMSVLRSLSHVNGERVSVALNGVFIRSSDWASQAICSDDQLMVIEASS